MEATNYCFEIVLNDRIYSLRAEDRLTRALWIYRLRLLSTIRTQISAHSQLLTKVASVTINQPSTMAESTTELPFILSDHPNLDKLSIKLLQTYAMAFGFVLSSSHEPEAMLDTGRVNASAQDDCNSIREYPTLNPEQALAKTFHGVPSRGLIKLDGGGTCIEIIPVFSSVQVRTGVVFVHGS